MVQVLGAWDVVHKMDWMSFDPYLQLQYWWRTKTDIHNEPLMREVKWYMISHKQML